eukprot:1213755-Prymnesium_polylepis.1
MLRRACRPCVGPRNASERSACANVLCCMDGSFIKHVYPDQGDWDTCHRHCGRVFGGRWPMLSPEAVSGRYARPA